MYSMMELRASREPSTAVAQLHWFTKLEKLPGVSHPTFICCDAGQAMALRKAPQVLVYDAQKSVALGSLAAATSRVCLAWACRERG